MTGLADILLVSQPQLDVLPTLADPLVVWYRRHARNLPWRENVTPYRVWISEIMLQQTRVEAVKGYFTRFLEALPTVTHLAQVPEDALLKLWEGLGYYSRARNLQRAARVILEEHDGAVPASYAQLLRLPGIGEYTAGAVGSIAFGIPVPAVDGNVYRVISRILMSYADTSRPPVKAAFREAVASMVPPDHPGDFNQALMELGATVCLPNAAPLCLCCPVAAHCVASRSGAATELPIKAKKKPRRIEERTILLIQSGDRLLLHRRGDKGLLAGMYQPINLEGHLTGEQAADVVRELGGDPGEIVPLGAAKHLFTHVEWQMQGFLISSTPFSEGQGVWAGEEALSGQLAIPSAFAPYMKRIGSPGLI